MIKVQFKKRIGDVFVEEAEAINVQFKNGLVYIAGGGTGGGHIIKSETETLAQKPNLKFLGATVNNIGDDTVVAGLKGDKGDKGDTGAQGIQGIQGIQGLKGDKGDTGEQGIQGERGLKGDKGDDGLTTSVNNIQQVNGNITLTAGDVDAYTKTETDTLLNELEPPAGGYANNLYLPKQQVMFQITKL
jgi:hypothetical protein